MQKWLYLSLFFLGYVALANEEVGCSAILDDKPIGCSSSNPLTSSSMSALDELVSIEKKVEKEDKNKIKISTTLTSVETIHDGHEVLIEREATQEAKSCPPFCIEPLTIKGVTTVAELETLHFIEGLKEKKGGLLIDVRRSNLYNKSTIPGAINLPAYMIEDSSPYQEEVLKLLGAKKIVKKNKKVTWYFKTTPSLLIFGANETTNEASSVIKKLLEFGYPASKLLFYRSGIEAWRRLGLSTI